MLSSEDIRERVTYHKPCKAGVEKHERLSIGFDVLMHTVEMIVPDGREKSIVFTKLEEAKFWASAGVARNPETR